MNRSLVSRMCYIQQEIKATKKLVLTLTNDEIIKIYTRELMHLEEAFLNLRASTRNTNKLNPLYSHENRQLNQLPALPVLPLIPEAAVFLDPLLDTPSTTEDRSFTVEELETYYNGKNGNPAYVAFNNFVFDVTHIATWGGGTHFGLFSGTDVTPGARACRYHNPDELMRILPMVGYVAETPIFDMETMPDVGMPGVPTMPGTPSAPGFPTGPSMPAPALGLPTGPSMPAPALGLPTTPSMPAPSLGLPSTPSMPAPALGLSTGPSMPAPALGLPTGPGVSLPPGVPGLPTVPGAPLPPGVPGLPTIPGVPLPPGVPGLPTIPGVPPSTGVPGMPTIPAVPLSPGVPGMPNITTPGASGAPGRPPFFPSPSVSFPGISGNSLPGVPVTPIPGTLNIPAPGVSIPITPVAPGIPDTTDTPAIPASSDAPIVPGAGVPGTGIPGNAGTRAAISNNSISERFFSLDDLQNDYSEKYGYPAYAALNDIAAKFKKK